MESFSTELFVWCAYGTCLASSFSSVEQIGHSDVVIDEVLVLEEVYCEWHAGVFRIELCGVVVEGAVRVVRDACEERGPKDISNGLEST